jgi:hypothetical protein
LNPGGADVKIGRISSVLMYKDRIFTFKKKQVSAEYLPTAVSYIQEADTTSKEEEKVSVKIFFAN